MRKDAYSPRQLTEILPVGEETVRIAVRLGTIPAVKVGRRWLITRQTVERLLAEGLPTMTRRSDTVARAQSRKR